MTPVNRKHTDEEILAAYAASGNSVREAARRLGAGRTTIRDRLERLLSAGPAGPDAQAEKPAPAEIHDASFWQRRAQSIERERNELSSILREVGHVAGLTIGKPTWLWSGPGERKGHSIPIIHNSDRHYGEVVEPREINGWNQYSPEICSRRVRRFIDASCEISRRWTDGATVDGVIYTMGGDEISGDIHDELRMTNAVTSLEQVQGAAQLHAECINQIVAEFGRVHVPVVPGNHGRTTQKPTAKKYGALSYDTMIGGLVAARFRDDDRVTFDIADGSDSIVSVYGRNIVITHGDKIGSGGGQGFAGPELPMLRGGHKIRAQYASAGMPIDLILGGHFHTSANLRGMLFNGSVVGQSEFGMSIRSPLDAPRQWVALYRNEWGLSERLDARLDEPGKPRVRIMPTVASQE